jgi:hypothetical protein
MINRLKKLFGSETPVTHKIVQCETRLLSSKDGPKSGIFIAADLYTVSALDALVHDLVERFKVHRLVSPPETSLLLITVIGECDARDVAARWRKRVAEDKIAGVWMARMEKADVGVGASSGQMTTAFQSILPEAKAQACRLTPRRSQRPRPLEILADI